MKVVFDTNMLVSALVFPGGRGEAALRRIIEEQDQLVVVRLTRLQAIVSLFQALGGGWVLPEDLADSRARGRRAMRQRQN